MIESKNYYRSISKEIWTQNNILKKEDIINTNLGQCLQDPSKVIMAYISMKDEVNILPCIKDLSSLQIPYTHKDKIGNCQYSEDLVINNMGFMAPERIIISTEEPDIIIIPGRFFDIKGNRIGRGKGFYDRFLTNHLAATFIGISLDQTLIELLPNNRDDVKMDIIVTEKEILNIK